MAPIDGVRIGKNTVTFLDTDCNFLGAILINQIESIDIAFSIENRIATYNLIITLLSGATKELTRKRRGQARVPEIETLLRTISEQIVQAVDDQK